MFFVTTASQWDHLWDNILCKFKLKKTFFHILTNEEKIQICRNATEVQDSRNYNIRMMENDEVGQVDLYKVEHTSDEYWMSKNGTKYQILAFPCPTNPSIFVGEGPINATGKRVIIILYQEGSVSSTVPSTTKQKLY